MLEIFEKSMQLDCGQAHAETERELNLNNEI